jgi:Ca2+/Na+ antiporter
MIDYIYGHLIWFIPALALGVIVIVLSLSWFVWIYYKSIKKPEKSTANGTTEKVVPNTETPPSPAPAVKKVEKVEEKKESKTSFFWLFATAMLVIGAIWYSNSGSTLTTPTKASATPFVMPEIGDTTEAALAAICEHESKCQQFKKDDGVTPLYNVRADGTENTDIACKYQIDMVANKALIEDLHADIANKEEDCERVARALYAEWGAWPWLSTLPQWAPNVVSKRFELTIPVEKGWGAEVPILYGFGYNTESMNSECYELKSDFEEIVRDCPNGILKVFKTRPRKVRFRSVDKTVLVRIIFYPR